MRHLLLTLCAAFALAACSSPPPPPPVPDALLAAPQGLARVIVYYPEAFKGSRARATVKLDGLGSCSLTSGHYIARDVHPGDVRFDVAFCGSSNYSSARLIAAAGTTYFVQLLPYDDSFTGLLSGYPHTPEKEVTWQMLANPNAEAKPQPAYNIKLMDKSSALLAMSKLYFGAQ